MRVGLLAAVLIISSGLAHAQDRHNGYWWAEMPAALKIGWVMGYVEGTGRLRDNVITECKINAAGLKLTADQAEKVCNCFPSLAGAKPPNATYGQIIEGINDFYSDYRNKNLEIDFAVAYVYRELSGWSRKALEEISEMRRKSDQLSMNAESGQ